MHKYTYIDSKNNNGIDILKSPWEVFDENQLQEFTLSNILVDFGCKLINYRLDNNLSQKDLAKKLNIPKEILIQLEKGEYNPTIK